MAVNLDDFTVQVTDSIRTAMVKINANRHRAVVVIDEGIVVGTVTDGDIRRAILDDVLPIAPVEKIMNLNCRTTTERDPARQTQLLAAERVTLLPVVDESLRLLDVVLAYEPFIDPDGDAK